MASSPFPVGFGFTTCMSALLAGTLDLDGLVPTRLAKAALDLNGELGHKAHRHLRSHKDARLLEFRICNTTPSEAPPVLHFDTFFVLRTASTADWLSFY